MISCFLSLLTIPLGGEHLMCCQSYYLRSGNYLPKRLKHFALDSAKSFPSATITKLELSHKHRNVSWLFFMTKQYSFWEDHQKDNPIFVSLQLLGQQSGACLNLHQNQRDKNHYDQSPLNPEEEKVYQGQFMNVRNHYQVSRWNMVPVDHYPVRLRN